MSKAVVDFVQMMMGCPIVKIEIEDETIEKIEEYVNLIVDVVAPNLTSKARDLAVKEGTLYHAKYVIGAIRNKYSCVPGPGGRDMQMNGSELIGEALMQIMNWREEFRGKMV